MEGQKIFIFLSYVFGSEERKFERWKMIENINCTNLLKYTQYMIFYNKISYQKGKKKKPNV